MMRTLKGGVLYFVLTFGAGFVLGTIRVMWAVPRFGERTAELIETLIPPLPCPPLGGGRGGVGGIFLAEAGFAIVTWVMKISREK